MHIQARALSKANIEQSARFYQQKLNPSGEAISIDDIFSATAQIPRLYGLKLIERSDEEMGDRYAYAIPGGNGRLPSIHHKASVLRDARAGLGRARMTFVHELAHIVLHSGDMEYARLFEEADRPKHMAAYNSAEYQANYWAACFLMPEHLVKECESAHEIEVRFRVSGEAARIRYEQVVLARRPQVLPKKVEALLNELRGKEAVVLMPVEHEKAWQQAAAVPGENTDRFRLSSDAKVVEREYYCQNHERGWLVIAGRVFSWNSVPDKR